MIDIHKPDWEYRSTGPWWACVTTAGETTTTISETLDAALASVCLAMHTSPAVMTVMVLDAHQYAVYGYDRETTAAIATRETTDHLIAMVDMADDMDSSLAMLKMTEMMRQDALNTQGDEP